MWPLLSQIPVLCSATELCSKTWRGDVSPCPSVFPNVLLLAQPACFPRSRGPAQVEIPSLFHAMLTQSTSQRSSCSHGSRPWISWLCQACANRPSATHFNLLFFLPPFLILHTVVILQAAWARYHSHYQCLVSSPDVSRGCCMLLQYKWLMMMIKGVGVGCLKCYPTLTTLF